MKGNSLSRGGSPCPRRASWLKQKPALELGHATGEEGLAGLPLPAGLEHTPLPTTHSPGAATVGDILAVHPALCPVPSPVLSLSHLPPQQPQEGRSIIIPILQIVKLRLKNAKC